MSKDWENSRAILGEKNPTWFLGICGNYGLTIMNTSQIHKVAITLQHLPKYGNKV